MPRGRKRTDEQSAFGWQSRPPTKRSCSNHNHHHQSSDCRIPCPFNEKLCLEWFREYTTADEPDLLGPEGMERFCEDIGVEPENVVMLVLAWKMNANSMGFFTREEWLLGMSQLKADSAAVLRTRIDYLRSLLESSDVFKSVYRFAFDFARDKRQRSVDVETGDAMMRLLLGRQWSAFSMFSVFLLCHSGLRVINKDQWTSVLEFSRTVQPGLANYDENGAWPVLLDEFVAWMRHQLPSEYPSTTASASDQRSSATNSASAATAFTVTSTVDVPM